MTYDPDPPHFEAFCAACGDYVTAWPEPRTDYAIYDCESCGYTGKVYDVD